MDLENLLVTLVVGALAGWIGGMIMKKGLSLIGMIVVGVVGAFIGAFLFNTFGIHIGTGIAAALISAVVGAVVLLFLLGLIKK